MRPAVPIVVMATATVLFAAMLLPFASAFTQPDQLTKLIKFRDTLIGTGPGWQMAFNTTDLGGQYVTNPSQTLGGPWICPTPPQFSDSECDPCGKNTTIPNPYWGNWDHVGCRGAKPTPANPEFSNPLIGDGIVTDLHITGIHIEGVLEEVAPLYCQFQYLKEIGANNHNFTGSFPDIFCDPGCFKFIQKIDLSYGTISGQLPPCAGQMPWLEEFKLQANNITGPIPASYGSAARLWWLDMGFGSISGGIPTTYANRTGLNPIEIFRFQNNLLTGPLYPLSQAALQSVALSGNEGLCGMIPGQVRYAHGYNTFKTNLGKPCPGETYPPVLPYMPYAYPTA